MAESELPASDNQFAHNVAPFQNRQSAAFTQPQLRSVVRAGGIGLNHLPSDPITHRAQARAVSVPQDA